MKITFSRQEKLEIIETSISWVVVCMMMVYGIAKVNQFNGAIEIDTPVSELSGMSLMWAFYGFSLPFAITLGIFEITGALLIFFKQTRIIGCFLTSIILTNIIIQDIVFEIHKGALIAAIIYQTLTLSILWINKNKLIKAFKIIMKYPVATMRSKDQMIIRYIITFTLFVILLCLHRYLTSFLSHLL